MKQTTRALLAVFSLAVTPAAAEDVALPPKPDFMIFLLAGQSNMAGRGKPVEEQDRTAHPRVLVLNKEQKWAPAVDPLHWDKPPVVGVGLGTSFGKKLADALPGKTIGLVPVAYGGSAISEWAKGQKHYNNAVERARAALESGTLAGILWHQGESDTAPERASQYQPRLDELIQNFRTDLDVPQTPLIVGTISKGRSPDGAILVNAALRGLPDRVPHTACVQTNGLQFSADGVHYNAASYRELGRRYADAWLKLARP